MNTRREADEVRAVRVEPPVAHPNADQSSESVAVLPLRESEDGIGIYPEATVVLVKALRAAGIEANYAHPPERRLFEGKKGVIGDVALPVVLGVISSGAWDGIKAWLLERKHDRAQLQVTFSHVETESGEVKWWRVEGHADAAIAAIDRILSTSSVEGSESSNAGRELQGDDEAETEGTA